MPQSQTSLEVGLPTLHHWAQEFVLSAPPTGPQRPAAEAHS